LLAHRCFTSGLGWLSDDAWTHDYALAHGLTAGGVEAAYLTGYDAVFERLAQTLKSRARDVVDQMPAWELEIDAATGREDYGRALSLAREAAGLLDVELPVGPGEAEIGAEVQAVLGALGGLGPQGVLELGPCEDGRVTAAMRILVRASPVAFFAAPAPFRSWPAS
jgi:predicted ATPase